MSVKQVILIRKDLKMRRGKEIAQGSHASMMWMSDVLMGRAGMTPALQEWLEGSFTKVVVRVYSYDELMEIVAEASDCGLPYRVVTDKGLTEFDGVSTVTAAAIGPYDSNAIDDVTGHLELY